MIVNQTCQADGVAGGKVRGAAKSLSIIHWGPWICVTNLLRYSPLDQSGGPADQPINKKRITSLLTRQPLK